MQFGALDPRCTMVQVHGDPNEPSLGAGTAVAPCVTLLVACSYTYGRVLRTSGVKNFGLPLGPAG